MPRRLIPVLLVVAAASATSALPALSTSPRTTAADWSGDFETGDFTQWTGLQRAAPDRIQIVQSPVRQGGYAARFEVRSGDYPAGSNGERAELFASTPDRPGTEWYYAWSTLFPKDFATDGNWKHMFAQWHGVGASANSSVSFQVWRGRLVARVGSPYTPTHWQQFDLGPLVHDVWQDFVFHVRWASDASGFVEIWRNGIHVVRLRHGVNCAPGEANYLKLGYYRDPSSATTVVYQDVMRRGTSLAEVLRPFRLAFVSPPLLRQRALTIDAVSFADARVVVTVGTARRKGAFRRLVHSDGSGHVRTTLQLPRALRGPVSVKLRALVDPSLRSAAFASAAALRR